MEIQTRIGIGGAAVFTVAGFAAPIVSWWVATPIMVACLGVAGWGFWPVVSEAAKRLRGKNEAAADRLTPMHKVIEHVAGRIRDTNGSKFWPEARLAIRQAALDGHVQVYGHKSENTGNTGATSWSFVSTLIPRGYWELADLTETAYAGYAEDFLPHTREHRLSDGRFTNEKIQYYAKTSANWSEVIKTWSLAQR
jgi:hypothetical protein